MSAEHELKNKIVSVESTKKITKAMELVSTSKIKSYRNQMMASRPYTQNIRKILAHLLLKEDSEAFSAILETNKTPEKVLYIVVSTDRGLCGALNILLFREVYNHIQSFKDNNSDFSFSMLLSGKKAKTFFPNEWVLDYINSNEIVNINDVYKQIDTAVQLYLKGEFDAIYLVYNQFINTMVQRPVLDKVLPVKLDDFKEEAQSGPNYIYEPNDPKEIIWPLAKRYLEATLYQAFLENRASEQASRMVSMKSATDNATELLDSLKLQANKLRQAKITQEIAEIASGSNY